MPRYALKLEYDGSPFVGWQWQPNGRSVQSVLDDAASTLAGTKVTSITAGRTDTGVHATAQVVHIDLDRAWRLDALRNALNFYMRPHPVVVLAAAMVPDDWHARFTAIGRAYRFRILNRPSRPALDASRVWHVPKCRLDADAMQQAAQLLVGRHDFTSFRATSCQAKSPVRTLDRLDVTRDGDEVTICAEARSFLHHQVRNMAGTLKLVGTGIWPPARVGEALAACNRAAAGPTAPPDGLALVGVRYPVDPFI